MWSEHGLFDVEFHVILLHILFIFTITLVHDSINFLYEMQFRVNNAVVWIHIVIVDLFLAWFLWLCIHILICVQVAFVWLLAFL